VLAFEGKFMHGKKNREKKNTFSQLLQLLIETFAYRALYVKIKGT
jgi:hypothetical protein